MANSVMVVAEHLEGRLSDSSFELVGKARELAGALGGQVVVALLGDASLAGELGAADVVLTVEDTALAEYTSEAYERTLTDLVRARSPRLVLLGTTTAGLDLAAALSVACDAPLVSYVVGLAVEGEAVVATAQIYGGKLVAEAVIEREPAIVAVIGGSFPAAEGRAAGTPAVEAIAPPAGLGDTRVKFAGLSKPEPGDVDITQADLLVAVGRGVGGESDLELVQELADAMDAPLAASRPVTDLGWLPKTRQVGKSGLKVKPKVYLMFGISGAPEHLEGMRDAELVIACNTDEKAPIFDVAQYGTTLDLFDLVPALTEKLEG